MFVYVSNIFNKRQLYRDLSQKAIFLESCVWHTLVHIVTKTNILVDREVYIQILIYMRTYSHPLTYAHSHAHTQRDSHICFIVLGCIRWKQLTNNTVFLLLLSFVILIFVWCNSVFIFADHERSNNPDVSRSEYT